MDLSMEPIRFYLLVQLSFITCICHNFNYDFEYNVLMRISKEYSKLPLLNFEGNDELNAYFVGFVSDASHGIHHEDFDLNFLGHLSDDKLFSLLDKQCQSYDYYHSSNFNSTKYYTVDPFYGNAITNVQLRCYYTSLKLDYSKFSSLYILKDDSYPSRYARAVYYNKYQFSSIKLYVVHNGVSYTKHYYTDLARYVYYDPVKKNYIYLRNYLGVKVTHCIGKLLLHYSLSDTKLFDQYSQGVVSQRYYGDTLHEIVYHRRVFVLYPPVSSKFYCFDGSYKKHSDSFSDYLIKIFVDLVVYLFRLLFDDGISYLFPIIIDFIMLFQNFFSLVVLGLIIYMLYGIVYVILFCFIFWWWSW